MTNSEMVKAVRPEDAPKPNVGMPQPMPAAEGSATPTTLEEPVDSPQPNASVRRAAPDSRHPGLATRRE